ncbi:MAG: TonB-dependent receptor [Bacteroidota bacterium]|nr:TonB-dependent receptor [Bacteroidota bacterium]
MKGIKVFIFICIFFGLKPVMAQDYALKGLLLKDSTPVSNAIIRIQGTKGFSRSDSSGRFLFRNIKNEKILLVIECVGFEKKEQSVMLKNLKNQTLVIQLKEEIAQIGEFVMTGTMRKTTKNESPIVVESYNSSFLKKNMTPNLFEALQTINGVRPQINCSVCNTGDIHINGLEGPYTMVLIDGMPIVSSLASVYGLSGIPNAMIERIEIVKGPASSLYGSEAIGGLINVITKKAEYAPLVSFSSMATSWHEFNQDLSFKLKINSKTNLLTGINHFYNSKIFDKNQDNFTDIALQNRLSIFNKISFERKEQREFNIGVRFLTEDRWGGETQWQRPFRGGDSVYGESVFTNRLELIGVYQLPIKEKVNLQFSYNAHHQNSAYGNTSYIAKQNSFFVQAVWQKKVKQYDFLAGVALRQTTYRDNLLSAFISDSLLKNQAAWLPGLFIQAEKKLSEAHQVLTGIRFDYHPQHGLIFTPRLAYKYKHNPTTVLRLNAGTGFRVVNLLTEEHAVMTGARIIQVENVLKPEQSINTNFNYSKTILLPKKSMLNIEGSVFYNYFQNRIVPNYDIDPNKIIFDNIDGYFYTFGSSLSAHLIMQNGLNANIGITAIDVQSIVNHEKIRPVLTEQFSGTWSIAYKLKRFKTLIDYSGNLYSPMRLPVLSEDDPRKVNSPWWSIQNIQFTYQGFKKMKIYGGIKNLLNYTPNRGNPFIIARANDPFDKQVKYDIQGNVLKTPENPYGMTFDPTYIFAPNQGIRYFMGLSFDIN